MSSETGAKRGLLITFEGPDGSGKSTQVRLLAEALRVANREVIETQEPGGTAIGNQIREILLGPSGRELSPTAELLLMFASRAQNVDEVILPALSAGKIVLSDRFIDSTLAYQGAGRGMSGDVIYELDRIACRGLVPDLTLLMDIKPEIGLKRAKARAEACGTETGLSRFEQYDLAFHRRVREAFLQLAGDDADRIHTIDGGESVEHVTREVRRIVGQELGLLW